MAAVTETTHKETTDSMSKRTRTKGKVIPDSGLESEAPSGQQALPMECPIQLHKERVEWADEPFSSEKDYDDELDDLDEREQDSQPPPPSPVPPSATTDISVILAQMAQMQVNHMQEAQESKRREDKIRKEEKEQRREEEKQREARREEQRQLDKEERDQRDKQMMALFGAQAKAVQDTVEFQKKESKRAEEKDRQRD